MGFTKLNIHRFYRADLLIPKNIVSRLTELYEPIIERGLSFHSSQSPLIRKGNPGRVKRRVGHNLLLRLSHF